MNSRVHFNRTAGLLAAGFVLVLQFGCTQQGEIAITTESEEARQLFLEGRQLFENLRFGEARGRLDKVLEKDSDFATGHLYRSLVPTSGKDRQMHLEHAMARMANATEGEQLLIKAQHAFWSEDDAVKSTNLFEELVKKYPRDKRARFFMGFTYSQRQEYDQAVAELEKATDLDKDFAPAYNILGYLYRSRGDYEQAEEAFNNYIRLLPNEPNPYDSMADLLTKMGRHEMAIDYFGRALERDPSFSMSQRKIGVNMVFLGRADEGREAIRKTMELRTTPAGKIAEQLAIGRSYLYEGNYQAALAAADRAIAMAGDENLPALAAGMHNGKCAVYLLMDDLEQAERSVAACRQLVASSSLLPRSEGNLNRAALAGEARIAARHQDFDAATAQLAAFEALAGADPNAMMQYHGLAGEIQLLKGAYGEAIEQFEKADQENPYTLYHFATALSSANQQDRATELYKKAANWNEDIFTYALIRTKAIATLE